LQPPVKSYELITGGVLGFDFISSVTEDVILARWHLEHPTGWMIHNLFLLSLLLGCRDLFFYLSLRSYK